MLVSKLGFSKEDMEIDECLGYPKAYSKICRSHKALNPYSQGGPPHSFLPHTLLPHEALRAKDLDHMFPIRRREEKTPADLQEHVDSLWKQLDHLGNAGFEPSLFRVDPYGNVLYLDADSASPLAWDVDHWFPCSRGGRTVPNNLRLVQWQVCKRKMNKLEFMVPWWDLQLGISVNQFLSIFASRNYDFRKRAFFYLFSHHEALLVAKSHSFPPHFSEMKRHLGLGPAAVVMLQRSSETSSVLKSLDINGGDLKTRSPSPVGRKFSTEEKKKKISEIGELEDELNKLKRSNEAESRNLQELEQQLIKKRRRVEKCRRLAEAQASYRALLEKMIRDAMHQSVVYKEQVRLNRAASSALRARLEAQRAICDTSEREIHKNLKQRCEMEKLIKSSPENGRKRAMEEEITVESLPWRKELREFLEEEYSASREACISIQREEEEEEEDEEDEEDEPLYVKKPNDCMKMVVLNDSSPDRDEKRTKKCEGESSFRTQKEEKCQLQEDKNISTWKNGHKLYEAAEKVHGSDYYNQKDSRIAHSNVQEERDVENMNHEGKRNVEKWLAMLLEHTEGVTPSSRENLTKRALRTTRWWNSYRTPCHVSQTRRSPVRTCRKS